MSTIPFEFSFLCTALSRKKDSQKIATLRAQLRSDALVWEKVIPFVNEHFLAPALYYELEQAGVLDAVEAEAAHYLKGVAQLNKERNERLQQQLLSVAHLLNKNEIIPAVMKGVHYLVPGTQLDYSIRMMSDLDLFVQPSELYRAVECCASAGYKSLSGLWYMERNSHHYAPLFHPDEPAVLELHESIGTLLIHNYVNSEEFLARSELVATDSAKLRILSANDQLLHNIVQSQVQDRFFFRTYIPLRQLYDFTTLAEAYADDIDWSKLQQVFSGGQKQELFASYLSMAQLHFNWQPPEQLRFKSRWHFPLTQLGLKRPKVAAPLNLLLGVCGVLERQSIRERYNCSSSLFSLTYFRIKHVLHLASLTVRPTQLRRLLEIARRSSNKTTAREEVPQRSQEIQKQVRAEEGGLICIPLEDRFVVFSPDTKAIHLLDEVSVSIWQALEEGAPQAELAEELSSRFEIPSDEAYKAVEAIVSLQSRTADGSSLVQDDRHKLLEEPPAFLLKALADPNRVYHQIILKVLGHRFRIQCPNEQVLKEVQRSAGHLAIEQPSPEDFPITIVSSSETDSEPQKYAMQVRTHRYYLMTRRDEVVPRLLSEIQRIASYRSEHWLAIHAAALSDGANVVVFPGISGSGKSSLTAGLSTRGCEFICDDIGLIQAEKGQRSHSVVPLPIPIGLKQGAWHHLEPIIPELRELDEFTHVFGMPIKFYLPERIAVEQPGSAATHLVFPKYAPGSELRVEPLSKCAALLKLTQSGYNANGEFDADFVSMLVDWIVSVDAYSMEYSSLDDAHSGLTQLVGKSSQIRLDISQRI